MTDKPSDYMKEIHGKRLEKKKERLKYTKHSKRRESLTKDIRYLERVIDSKKEKEVLKKGFCLLEEAMENITKE